MNILILFSCSSIPKESVVEKSVIEEPVLVSPPWAIDPSIDITPFLPYISSDSILAKMLCPIVLKDLGIQTEEELANYMEVSFEDFSIMYFIPFPRVFELAILTRTSKEHFYEYFRSSVRMISDPDLTNSKFEIPAVTISPRILESWTGKNNLSDWNALLKLLSEY
jgi:hypothetical protein